MDRTCSVCRETKHINGFHKNGKDKDGNPAFRNDCKECYTITRNIKKRHKVAKFINNTKHRTGEVATLTLHDWRDALLHFRGACAYCVVKQSRKVKLTKEHVVPVSKGGLTTRENVIPGCVSCNSSKSNHDLIDWYPQQPFYSEARMELILAWTNSLYGLKTK